MIAAQISAQVAGVAARTASGKEPPMSFVVTLWALVIFFAGLSVVCAIAGWRNHQRAKEVGQIPAKRDARGRVIPPGPEHAGEVNYAAKSGCLLTALVPSVMLTIFLASWLIGIS